MIVRPSVPVIFSNPFPSSPSTASTHRRDRGHHPAASGGSPSGKLAAGTRTHVPVPDGPNDALGREQFGIGPAAILGWKTSTRQSASSRSTSSRSVRRDNQEQTGREHEPALLRVLESAGGLAGGNEPGHHLRQQGHEGKQVERADRARGGEDHQSRRKAREIPVRLRVLGREPGRLRDALSDQVERHSRDRLL